MALEVALMPFCFLFEANSSDPWQHGHHRCAQPNVGDMTMA